MNEEAADRLRRVAPAVRASQSVAATGCARDVDPARARPFGERGEPRGQRARSGSRRAAAPSASARRRPSPLLERRDADRHSSSASRTAPRPPVAPRTGSPERRLGHAGREPALRPGATKLSITFLVPALSKAISSLSPSTRAPDRSRTSRGKSAGRLENLRLPRAARWPASRARPSISGALPPARLRWKPGPRPPRPQIVEHPLESAARAPTGAAGCSIWAAGNSSMNRDGMLDDHWL